MPTLTATRSNVHQRITAAIRADQGANLAQWGKRLGLSRQAMNHRVQGRTPWQLDEALEVATRLGTTMDALRDGTYLAHQREGHRPRCVSGCVACAAVSR